MSKAVVLLSGGLDSTTTLAQAIADNNEVVALSFRYGQKHDKELTSASNISKFYNIKHVIVDMNLSMFRSALTDTSINVPEDRNKSDIGSDIPVTYVPARNMIMLSVAVGLSESVNADKIYIGANVVDYSGYPDCRPEFLDSFEKMINVGTKAGVEGRPIKIVCPILNCSKADIVRLGKKLGAPLHLTWSCYNGKDKACGKCDSCKLRLKGFKESGFKDEIEYE
ncbi:MAG: 7-cyano-7-deazaguanine synthase QueC [archaeon]|nr:7-cyano-7-deazaguanine synthase QueC [archaeon]